MDFHPYSEHEPVPFPADFADIEDGVTYTFAMPPQPVPEWTAKKAVHTLRDPSARIVPSAEFRFRDPYVGVSEEDKAKLAKQFEPPTLPQQEQ